MRYLFIIMLLMLVNFAYAQESVMSSTSATDGTVKIHRGRKSKVRTTRSAKKSGEVLVYENQTKSVSNKKKVKKLPGEANVFRRHNQSARKDTPSRGRQKKKFP